MSKYLIVKVQNNQTDIIERINDSLDHQNVKYYNVNNTDKNIISKFEGYFTIIFIVFRKEEENFSANILYFGTASINQQQNIEYTIIYKSESKLVIDNFIKNSGLDLIRDFEKKSYLSIETSSDLLRQLEFALKDIYQFPINNKQSEEKNYYYENELHEFAQRSKDCVRAIGIIPPHEYRSEFQRDRERIVHSKASRRLVDKAQIFTSSKGDHYRTRMTHTLEVSQIARGIAIRLKVNQDLTEAIALSHDIGHTPFGHEGERTLDDILSNNIKLIVPPWEKFNFDEFGGFKHNYQSLRVLTYLEEKYLEHEGLDVSYQVLEGVLKHTKLKKKYDIMQFLINGNKDYLYLDNDFPTTLEGQIVAIADEIAQRGHDLDDAFASRHLNFDELLSYTEIQKMKPINNILKKIKAETDEIELKNRVFIDKDDMLRSLLVSKILGYFINDVVNQSQKNMTEFTKENEFYAEKHRFNTRLIEFSNEGKFILEYLEKIISKKVINSSEVVRFDDKARRIITALFKAYYNNPILLPDSALKRISRDIKKINGNVIDFRNGDIVLVRRELEKSCYYQDQGNEEYKEKRKILVRNIADHIAGMTDNYALNEYNLLYETR